MHVAMSSLKIKLLKALATANTPLSLQKNVAGYFLSPSAQH